MRVLRRTVARAITGTGQNAFPCAAPARRAVMVPAAADFVATASSVTADAVASRAVTAFALTIRVVVSLVEAIVAAKINFVVGGHVVITTNYVARI